MMDSYFYLLCDYRQLFLIFFCQDEKNKTKQRKKIELCYNRLQLVNHTVDHFTDMMLPNL